ncbi:MAG: response regulator transcription factor [Alphaproteobacteria bacterium]|nr:response regulator transcription factor [Alphaproteobacteria bacterium]
MDKNGTAGVNPEVKPHVLVVDDDARIRQLVSRYLTQNGFVSVSASSAGEARELMESLEFDALVVDIMMPDETGLAFTSALRERSDIPVLLLTALGDAQDRIAGFENGADDYLPKPFEPRELVLRLQALLRRRPKPVSEASRFRVGRWSYDGDADELIDEEGGDIVRLTAVEANLLRGLASRAGEAVSREELARICNMESGERTIDVQVTRLRRKLEEDSRTPRLLQTVRGKGYMLRTTHR